MSIISQITQLEGTWEELLTHGDQFAGKRVRITVLGAEDQAELRRRASKIMADVDNCQPDANPPKLSGMAREFADAVADKLGKQGIES